MTKGKENDMDTLLIEMIIAFTTMLGPLGVSVAFSLWVLYTTAGR